MGHNRHVRHGSHGAQRIFSACAALMVAGVILGGVGPAQPLAPQGEEVTTHSAPPDEEINLVSQPSITVADHEELGFTPATAKARAAKRGDKSVCISSPLTPGSFRITSNFGMRTNPITGGAGLHAGVDLAAPMGTPIHAIADGVVSYAGSGKAGRSSELVIIDHDVDGKEFSSWYVHMYPHGVFVEAGQEVTAGEKIAAVGSNGFSTGPHLHLEIHSAAQTTGATGQSFARILPRAKTDQDTETEEGQREEGESKDESPSDEVEAPETEDEEDSTDGELGPAPSPTPEKEESDGEEELDDPEEPSPQPEEPTTIPEDWDEHIEEDDDQGRNDHTIGDVIQRDSGTFDPSSLGVLHDPLPFLKELGYGLKAPSECRSQ